MRGTYAGLSTPPVIDHLKRLGVTAVEFLPIQTFVDDRHLLDRGLKNYWGYNSIGYFAPDPRYSASGRLDEFKHLVKTLHAAGIEVIMDVVYNHTAEGNHLGPTLCFRGIDNAAYYRLVADAPRYYMDYTGCGNTLNMMHPRVLQLIMDSLRTGSSRCTSMVSASIWQPPWPGSCTKWISSAPSWTSFTRTRCCRR
jgi:isoamylase